MMLTSSNEVRPFDTTPTVDSSGKGKWRTTWIILFILALITLALTILFGYHALAPSDTFKH